MYDTIRGVYGNIAQFAERRGVMARVGINLDEFLRAHHADCAAVSDGSFLTSHRLSGSYVFSGSYRFLTSYAASYSTSYRYASSFTTSFGTSFKLSSSFKGSFASSFADRTGSARADYVKDGYIPVFGYGINLI